MGIETIAILFFVAFGASFLDAIAGGGGLITLPALMISGVSPVAALGTSKFQSSAGTISAAIAYARRGLLAWKTALPIFLMSCLGGAVGAVLASSVPQDALEVVVPVLLVMVAFYFYLSPKIADEAKKARLSSFVFCLTIAPLLGFYDGVFGPGAGSFFMAAFVSLLGFGILNAIAYTKVANAASNLGALVIFAAKGAILWPVAIPMAVGAVLGAQLGARFAVRFGAKLVKPLIIMACLGMAAKLLLDPSNPITRYFLQ